MREILRGVPERSPQETCGSGRVVGYSGATFRLATQFSIAVLPENGIFGNNRAERLKLIHPSQK